MLHSYGPPLLATLVLASAGACSDGGSAAPDARPSCWPIEDSTPAGSLELGHAAEDFAPLEDGAELELEEGVQGGIHVRVSLRMTGLDPGDPTVARGPQNPKTLLTIVDDDDGKQISVGSCANQTPYELVEGDTSEMVTDYFVVVDHLPAFERLGQELLLRGEVIDSKGRYAKDEVRFVLLPPPGYFPPDGGPGDAGSGDAGAGDAGLGDAGAADAGAR